MLRCSQTLPPAFSSCHRVPLASSYIPRSTPDWASLLFDIHTRSVISFLCLPAFAGMLSCALWRGRCLDTLLFGVEREGTVGYRMAFGHDVDQRRMRWSDRHNYSSLRFVCITGWVSNSPILFINGEKQEMMGRYNAIQCGWYVKKNQLAKPNN